MISNEELWHKIDNL